MGVRLVWLGLQGRMGSFMRRVRGVLVGMCRMIMLLLSNWWVGKIVLSNDWVFLHLPKAFNGTDVFFDQGFANVGNEPGLLQAMLYHYAVYPLGCFNLT